MARAIQHPLKLFEQLNVVAALPATEHISRSPSKASRISGRLCSAATHERLSTPSSRHYSGEFCEPLQEAETDDPAVNSCRAPCAEALLARLQILQGLQAKQISIQLFY